MSRSVGASSSNPGVSIQTVRQLIDESHLDLVNLLTQHLTSILNSIMADTNSKYDYLANQVERVSQLVHDDNTENQNNAENIIENNLGGGNVRIVQRSQNVEQVLHEVRNLNRIDQYNVTRVVEKVLNRVGRLKFEEAKPEMKIDTDPFEVNSSFVEPCCFGQKLKDRDVSLCPRCNAVFDADAAALFEKERMKKELAHKEEQVHQRQGARRTESSNVMVVPPIQMQWVGGSSGARFLGYNDFPGHRNFRGGNRGRGRGRGFSHRHFRGRVRFHSRNAKSSSTAEASPSENKNKGAKTSALHRVVFPENQGKGKEVAADPKVDSEFMKEDEGDDLYDDEFVEEDEMISVVSILPAEFTDSSRECLDGDYYDPAQGEDFLWFEMKEKLSLLDQLKKKKRT
ncbi:hypothetical protein PIB30_062157 [Stylosanthes scabra]|uniref:Uncharacterized protein n=1 Tax=Stylosanthes scabra TaxID=79078 RepID=A0ABU6WJG3_9FABA|nr:hypothetical protein [Stylosanthes scabra]